MRTRVLSGLALAAVAALAGVSQAAIIVTPTVLSGQIGSAYSPLSFPSGSYNDLTSYGSSDWAYFGGGAGGAISKVNQKSGGSGIGLPVFANPNRNGTVQNQTGGYVGTHFTFADGTSPSNAADITSAGVTATRGGSLTYSNDPGPSFQFSVPVSNADSTLTVWFSGYKAYQPGAYKISVWDGLTQIGTTLSVDGAPAGDTGTAYAYQFVYGGGTTTSGTVDFKFQMTGGNQDNATLTLNAAALTTIPEPATLSLVGLAGLTLLRRRRIT